MNGWLVDGIYDNRCGGADPARRGPAEYFRIGAGTALRIVPPDLTFNRLRPRQQRRHRTTQQCDARRGQQAQYDCRKRASLMPM